MFGGVDVSGITGALAQLQQQRRQSAMDEENRRREREAKRVNRAGNLAGLAAAGGVGFATGNPALAAYAFSGGQQLGRGAAGGQIDPGVVVQSGLGAAGESQRIDAMRSMEQQRQSERGMLQSIAPPAQRGVGSDAGITASQSAQVPAISPQLAQMRDAAQGGQTPMSNFAAGVGALNSLRPPPPPRPIALGAGGELVTQEGVLLRKNQKDAGGGSGLVVKEIKNQEGQTLYQQYRPDQEQGLVAVGPPTMKDPRTREEATAPILGKNAIGFANQVVSQMNEKRRTSIALTPQEQEHDSVARQIMLRGYRYTDPDSGQIFTVPGINPPPVYVSRQAGQDVQQPAQQAQPQAQAPSSVPPVPAGTPITNAPPLKQITPAQLKDVQDMKESINMLDIIEENIGGTGRIEGGMMAVGEFLGVSEEGAIAKTARDKLRLSMQATLKGIPSDRDQKLIDAVMVNFTDTEVTKKAKISIMRAAIQAKMDGQFDYLRKNRMSIPQELKAAKAMDSTGKGTQDDPYEPKTDAEYQILVKTQKGKIFRDPEDGKLYPVE